MIFTIYKNEGQTPLEAIERYKKENPETKDDKMTYAGRLDPMAEGILVILSGEDTKRKEEFLGMEKEYEFEILWGVKSDSFDILGIPKLGKRGPADNLIYEKILGLKGEITLPYPAFSSRTVLGKPLFEWMRSGKISEIELPERKMEINKIEILENRKIAGNELTEKIIGRIRKVEGDFRQEEIMEEWKKVLKDADEFKITKCRAEVSSGTYIRSLAEYLGKELGSGALAWNIKRLRVGNFS